MSFKQLTRFTNSAAGLEKILRLLQSLSQILSFWPPTPQEAEPWHHLRRQFALGRRYFRFFKFLDCFEKAATFTVDPDGVGAGMGIEGIERVLGLGRWCFMGAYLMMESLTILDAVGVWVTPWAAKSMVEANRLWFFSLVCSILWGLIRVFGSRESVGEVGQTGEERDDGIVRQEKKKDASKSQEGVKRRLVSDCFDLLIPGHVTGWIPTSIVTVGFASVVSTVLSSKDIWDKLKE